MPEGTVVTEVCTCHNCGESWPKRIEGRPKKCPSCQDRRWDEPGERPLPRKKRHG